MMKLTVTIWAACYGIVHRIGATIGETSDVMNLEEWVTIVPLEWRRTVTHLTNIICPAKNPGAYLRITDEMDRFPLDLSDVR